MATPLDERVSMLPAIDRAVRRSETGNAMKLELSRFLILRAKSSRISPSPMIDKAWHELIIDTMGYESVCRAILGKSSLIHHDPEDAKDPDEKIRSRYLMTMSMYYQVFKQSVPKDATIWPKRYAMSIEEMIDDVAESDDDSIAHKPVEKITSTKRVKTENLWSILVKYLYNETYYQLSPTATIKDLMTKINHAWGIPVEQIRLVYAGQQLHVTQEDLEQVLLGFKNIKPFDKIHVLLRLSGC